MANTNIDNDDYRRTVAEEKAKEYAANYPRVRLISTAEILAMQQESAKQPVLVDVRSEAECMVSMIPGALTQAQFEALIETDESLKKTPIIPYCTIGMRSGAYGTRLLDAGYERVYNGEGILLWTHNTARHFTHTENEVDDGSGADSSSSSSGGSSSSIRPSVAPPLVAPVSLGAMPPPGGSQTCKRVHVFSSSFDYAATHYTAVTETSTWDYVALMANSIWRMYFSAPNS